MYVIWIWMREKVETFSYFYYKIISFFLNASDRFYLEPYRQRQMFNSNWSSKSNQLLTLKTFGLCGLVWSEFVVSNVCWSALCLVLSSVLFTSVGDIHSESFVVVAFMKCISWGQNWGLAKSNEEKRNACAFVCKHEH